MIADMLLTAADKWIVYAYLLLVLAIGFIASRSQTFEGYWVNRRRTGFVLLLASLISTQVGAGVIVGLAAAAYEAGIGYPLVGLLSTVGGFILVAALAPRIKTFGDATRAITIAEYLRVRYSRSTEYLGAVVVLLGYVSFLGSQFLAIGRLLEVVTPLAILPAILLTSVALVLYTAYAGVRGDLFTDAVHLAIMVLAIPFLFRSIMPLVSEPVRAAIPLSHWSPASFGGWGFVIGGLFFGMVLAVSSMELWQRIYAARGGRQARAVFLVGAVGVVPFYVIATGLGLLGRAILGPGKEPDGILYPLVVGALPSGARGLVIAALAAAFLSTANSMILVLSGTIARNLLQLGTNKGGTERRSLWISRGLTLAIGGAGLLAAILFPSIVQLTLNAFYLIGLLAPPLLGGMLWARPTAGVANAAIVLGLLATIIALPFAPRQAFLAAAAVSVPVFIIGALFARRDRSPAPSA